MNTKDEKCGVRTISKDVCFVCQRKVTPKNRWVVSCLTFCGKCLEAATKEMERDSDTSRRTPPATGPETS